MELSVVVLSRIPSITQGLASEAMRTLRAQLDQCCNGDAPPVHALASLFKEWVAKFCHTEASFFEFCFCELRKWICNSDFAEQGRLFGLVPHIAWHDKNRPIGLWNVSRASCAYNSVLQQLMNIPQWCALMWQQPIVPSDTTAVHDEVDDEAAVDRKRATHIFNMLQQLMATVQCARQALHTAVSPDQVIYAMLGVSDAPPSDAVSHGACASRTLVYVTVCTPHYFFPTEMPDGGGD